MADAVKNATANAPGKRQDDNSNNQVAAPARVAEDGTPIPDYVQPGFSKDDVKNMGGSLKIHARLALEIDIRVIAKIKGDVAIGIL